MPKKRSEEDFQHSGEGCDGTPVVEFNDSQGEHLHCPRCGAWLIRGQTTTTTATGGTS